MDSAKLILTEPVWPPTPLEHLDKSRLDGISEEKKKQIAKDFESILLSELMDEMKNTIGDWGFDKDGASQQIEGIFWLYLARDIANNGGFGLWKDIYKFLTNADQTNPPTQWDPESKIPRLGTESLDGHI
jgi:Rod binding domain-containing protein